MRRRRRPSRPPPDRAGAPLGVEPARAYTGRAGEANYAGSIAWYRTRVAVANAGLYAFAFQSASFRAHVFIDGRELGSHRGAYLPFELRTRLAPGTHALVVRVDWRD